MGSYKEHQNLLRKTMLAVNDRWPRAICLPRITGFFYTQEGTGIRIGHEGEADLEVLFPTKYFLLTFYAEIKTGTSKQSKKQKIFERNIIERNGLYVVVRDPSDMISAIDFYLKRVAQLLNFSK